MKKYFVILSFFFISLLSFGNFENDDYSWEEKPVRHTLTAEEEAENTVRIKDVRILEYAYNDESKLEMLYVIHKIIRVNNDAAVNDNNKVYISMYGVIDVVQLQVRSINKAGKITELNKDNIKEIGDLEKNQGYKIFAIEGVEVGSEIEYVYILRCTPELYGREYFQFENLNKDITFKIICPDNLVFETKSFNGFPALKDTTYDEKNYLTVSHASAPVLLEEMFANNARNRMRVEYRLSYNKYSNDGKSRLFSYAEVAKNIYANTHPVDTKSDKAVLKLINTMGLAALPDGESKIKAIEKYVKNHYVLVEASGSQFSTLSSILKGKQASERGIVILYNKIFELAKIKYELVVTSDRMKLPFDQAFDSWDYLSHYAYYFPETEKFLAPGEVGMRYPMIPYEWLDNYGLFIKPVVIGEIRSGVSEVKYIPENSYKETYDNLNVTLTFKMDEDNVLIDLSRSLGGYSGNPISEFYDLISDEDKNKVLKQLSEGTIEDAQMISGEATGTDRDQCTFFTPVVLNFKMESSSLLESAGDKYIFNVGKVIGEQSQLYQEKERKQPVECDYNRAYARTIVINIPEGYTFANLDKLNISQEMKNKEGVVTCKFHSEYKIEGNKIIITIEEFYSQIHYPLSEFEQYRSVVNAAADFNKVTILLQKK
ncbi:DUF3857 domain-containing protein [Cytophaga aurantiaca]|uniref:DUF3857 domain-containing protein n=1 Tax=Cytophaga aurantiaca TaxID=29530 RepID=UPI0003672994|nr:DUF3857 domain-containing protein [Cytophaga aurantiaca]